MRQELIDASVDRHHLTFGSRHLRGQTCACSGQRIRPMEALFWGARNVGARLQRRHLGAPAAAATQAPFQMRYCLMKQIWHSWTECRVLIFKARNLNTAPPFPPSFPVPSELRHWRCWEDGVRGRDAKGGLVTVRLLHLV